MNREEAKDLFRKDRDSYGKVKSPISKIDLIYNEIEKDGELLIGSCEAIIRDCLVFKYSDWVECVHCKKGTQITDVDSYDNHDKDCIVLKAREYISNNI
jgi:hypothetical protein